MPLKNIFKFFLKGNELIEENDDSDDSGEEENENEENLENYEDEEIKSLIKSKYYDYQYNKMLDAGYKPLHKKQF